LPEDFIIRLPFLLMTASPEGVLNGPWPARYPSWAFSVFSFEMHATHIQFHAAW